MKKVITILQLIIGFLVLLFAIIIFYQSLVALIPSLNIVNLRPGFGIKGMSPILQLILSIFLIQVIAVYTKNVFDKLSVQS